MRYAEIDDLIERVSVNDLAERAAPDSPAVTGALLQKKVNGEAIQGETADTVAALERAVERLNDALNNASADVDRRLAAKLPLPNPAPRTVKVATVDIALYRFFGGDPAGERAQLYQAAQDWLRDVAAGAAPFADDVGADQDGRDVFFDEDERVFTRQTLDGYLGR